MLTKRLQIQPGITAIIGSGGKTTLIKRLCEALEGTVIVCTSTHIFPAENLPFYEKIEEMPAEKLCLGTRAALGKLTAPRQSFAQLAALADYVLVEADGSRGLPLKAHGAHEPVIPPGANQVIQVVGLSGLGRPVSAVHRPELYAAICGCAMTDMVTPERAAAVLNTEALADRYVLNQADDLEEQKWGRTLASLLDRPALVVSLRI